MESDPNNNIVALRREGTEFINGTAVALGHLPLQRLLQIEAECRAQLEEARTDLYIVRDYIDRLFPEDGGAA